MTACIHHGIVSISLCSVTTFLYIHSCMLLQGYESLKYEIIARKFFEFFENGEFIELSSKFVWKMNYILISIYDF